MKNILLLVLVLILIPYIMLGQSCLSEGITFDHQWQVDEFPVNFPGCRHILGHVIVNDSAAIHSLDSLYTVDSISGDLRILYNSLLPDFQGLNQLSYLGGDLDVHYSTGLESYAGLENLVEIKGDFTYDYFNEVPSFSDFASLKKIGGTLSLFSFTKNSLDFPVLSRVNGNLHVSYGYMSPEDDQFQIFTGPDSLEYIGGDVRFGNDFPNEDPPWFDCRGVTHIYGFEQLDTIWGSLAFNRCSELLDASGFSSLKYIGNDLEFYLLSSLKTIDFLQDLNYIGGSFNALGAGKDTTLAFLNNLEYLGKDFRLAIHRTRDLAPLQSFTNMNGRVSISSCSYLTSLQDMKNIKTIEGSLHLQGNDLLETLIGLEGLEYIGDSLLIMYNDTLSSLDGLGAHLGIGKYLSIQGNPQLSICGVDPVCAYLEDPLAPAFIGENHPGCNSRPEVEEACGLVSIPSLMPSAWRITPNPGDGLYRIEFPMQDTDFQVTVFDLYGRKMHHQATLSGAYLDIRALPAGTYMVQIQHQDNIGIHRIQKW